jgi:hypothetical protein
MTTWAYKDGVVACDTLSTFESGHVAGKTSKMVKLTDRNWHDQTGLNIILVGSGYISAMQWIFRTVSQLNNIHDFVGDQMPVPDGLEYDVWLFVQGLDKMLMVSEEDKGVWNTLDLPSFWAGGSGGKFALGALAAGSSLARALEIASDFDTCTRSPWHFEDLKS